MVKRTSTSWVDKREAAISLVIAVTAEGGKEAEAEEVAAGLMSKYTSKPKIQKYIMAEAERYMYMKKNRKSIFGGHKKYIKKFLAPTRAFDDAEVKKEDGLFPEIRLVKDLLSA